MMATKFVDLFKHWTFYGPFSLLFCLVPYRILGAFHLEFYAKLLVLIGSFVMFYFFICTNKSIISRLFDNFIFQYFFYLALSFENLVWNMSPWVRYATVFCLGLNLGAWPSRSEDPAFYYLLFIFLYTFYNHLKMLFLNPSFEASIYPSLMPVKEKEENLTWSHIVENISSISSFFFSGRVSNQLGEEKSKKSFPHLTKRYVFNRAFSAIKTHPELITIAGTFGGCLGYGISELKTDTRHREVIEEAKRANLEAQRANLEAQRANLEAQRANLEAQKANALKEVELKIISPEDYRLRFGLLKQVEKVQTSTALVSEKVKATSPRSFLDESLCFMSSVTKFFFE